MSGRSGLPGVHCDIGGGYPEAESGLSKLALEWMLREAVAHGLLVNQPRVDRVLGRAGTPPLALPDPNAKMHESLKRAWRLAEFIPKRHFDWKRKGGAADEPVSPPYHLRPAH